ncbi:hypothetical protein KI387_014169, partial [Taxus chinensis]
MQRPWGAVSATESTTLRPAALTIAGGRRGAPGRRQRAIEQHYMGLSPSGVVGSG